MAKLENNEVFKWVHNKDHIELIVNTKKLKKAFKKLDKGLKQMRKGMLVIHSAGLDYILSVNLQENYGNGVFWVNEKESYNDDISGDNT